MATRSLIGKLNSDNTVNYIYCHWDGYVEHNGFLLQEHYNTPEKVNTLLALGDLSSLGSEIGEKHEFENRLNRDWCTAYGRDRGEKGVSWKTTTFEMYPKADDATEYQYLFTDKGWKVNGGGDWELVVDMLSEIN